MKTKSKKKRPLGACGTDTNQSKRYEVTVARTDYLYTRIRVKAESEDAAETAAEQRAEVQEESQWDCADRDLYALEVEQVKDGGQNNE